ncbi:MAG: phosphoribosylglycinamide formyltransferase [Gammaproteobacteria bacterium]
MKKIVVLISGSGSNLQAIIDKCSTGYINAEIVCVISNNPNAYGLERARVANIPVKVINHKDYKSRSLYDDELFQFLQRLNIDLIVLAGFMRILSSKITDNYYGKIVNIHPSLLPKYPGLNTHEKVFKNNDHIHGVTVHYVSSELDAGPIIAQGEIKILDNSNINNLIERIHKVEHQLYPEIIKHICDENIYLDIDKITFKNIKIDNNLIYKIYDL